MRYLRVLGALGFAMLAFAAANTAAALATEVSNAEWLVEGNALTEPLAAETEEELEIADLKTIAGTTAVLCLLILVGTVGPGEADEVSEILNAAKEKIGSNLTGTPLLCKSVKVCEEGTDIEVWPDNLPWVTTIALMGSEPEFLDQLYGHEGGKEPGWEVKCLVIGATSEDLCEGQTSSKLENLTEGDVLTVFNPEAPISSESGTCSQGGAGSGDTTGEGTVLLTSGKSLAVSTHTSAEEGGAYQFPRTPRGSMTNFLYAILMGTESKEFTLKLLTTVSGGEINTIFDFCTGTIPALTNCDISFFFLPLAAGLAESLYEILWTLLPSGTLEARVFSLDGVGM